MVLQPSAFTRRQGRQARTGLASGRPEPSMPPPANIKHASGTRLHFSVYASAQPGPASAGIAPAGTHLDTCLL